MNKRQGERGEKESDSSITCQKLMDHIENWHREWNSLFSHWVIASWCDSFYYKEVPSGFILSWAFVSHNVYAFFSFCFFVSIFPWIGTGHELKEIWNNIGPCCFATQLLLCFVGTQVAFFKQWPGREGLSTCSLDAKCQFRGWATTLMTNPSGPCPDRPWHASLASVNHPWGLSWWNGSTGHSSP